MIRSFLASLLTAVLALTLSGQRAHAAPAADANPVTLVASDGVKVYGWVASTGDKSKPIILLFHQAGSNHAEYDPIAPELVRAGFNTLALDQRSGSERWGQPNRTAKELGKNATYNDAFKDLQAAVTWAKAGGYTGKIIVWGSSYSSSLVFLLAAEQPAVSAVLSFSPGEYLGGESTVKDAAAKVKVPVFITSAKSKEEVTEAKAIFTAVASAQKTQFIPQQGGVHGSSTLRKDKNARGMDENWKAVKTFLDSVR